MKLFFINGIGNKLAKYFDPSIIVPFQEGQYITPLTAQETVETLFDCIRIFKEFAYKPLPFRG